MLGLALSVYANILENLGIPSPKNLRITASTASTITFEWDEVSGVDGYQLDIFSDSGCTILVDSITVVGGATTTYVWTMSGSSNYFTKIKAYKGATFSDYSNKVEYAQFLTDQHITRVGADGGIIDDAALTLIYFRLLLENGVYNSIITDTDPRILGYKVGATSNRVTKLYSSVTDGSADWEQITANNQPQLSRYEGERYMQFNGGTGYGSGLIRSDKLGYLPQNFRIDWKLKLSSMISGDNDLLNAWNQAGTGGTGVQTHVFEIYNGTFYGVCTDSDNLPYINVSQALGLSNDTLYYLRFEKSGTDLTLSYSTDNVTFNTIQTWPVADKESKISTNYWALGGSTSLTSIEEGKVYSMSITNTDTDEYYVKLDFDNYTPASYNAWTATDGTEWQLIQQPITNLLFPSGIITYTVVSGNANNRSIFTADFSPAFPVTHIDVSNWSPVNLGDAVLGDLNANAIEIYNSGGNVSVGDGAVDYVIGTVPSKRVILVQTKNGTHIGDKGVLNNGTINSGDAGSRALNGYSLFCSANSDFSAAQKGMFIALATELDNTQIVTIRDAINNLLYDGEFY